MATKMDADEQTPLLAAASKPLLDNGADGQAQSPIEHQGSNDLVSGQDDADSDTLPKLQILFLCLARITEPLNFFMIFPFVNQMIYDTGEVKEEDVGNFSGLIESLFSLTQMFVMISWGRAADRFGRKPVLVCSMCGTAVAATLFGFATTIWQMILFRCFAGFFSGTIVTVRAMFSEISNHRTQARAYSFFAFSGNLGIFLGPLIGGALARPATEYPRYFGHIQLFKDYPYALPTMFVGVLAAFTALVSALFIKETLPAKKDGEAPRKPMPTWDLLRTPGVLAVLGIYATIMILPLAFTAIAPVYWFTSIRLGGYGWSPRTISYLIGLGGFSQSLWLLIAFPWLQRRIGTGGVLRLCSYMWPFFMCAWPAAHYLLLAKAMPAFWLIVATNEAVGSGVAMAFTGVQLSLNDIAPSPAALGSLNAIALSLVCGIRAVAPGLFASMFALTVKHQILGGQLIWLILLVLTVVYMINLRFLPEKAEGRPENGKQQQDNQSGA